MTTHILALERDLFFAVKIRDTLQHHGIETTIARNLASFAQKLAATDTEKPALVVINISIQGVDWEEAIRKAHEGNYPILAFGSHMDLEARQRALQAGAQLVVANSKFASDMPGLVKRMLGAQPADTASEADDDEN